MSTYGPTTPNPSLEVYGSPATPVGPPAGGARTAIADANYQILSSDRLVALTSITASRTWTLPLASAFPVGTYLWIQDESGFGGAGTLTIATSGSDTLDGASSVSLYTAYSGIILESNGGTKWSFSPQYTVSRAVPNSYTVTPSDRSLAISNISAVTTITLPLSTTYPRGVPLLIFDSVSLGATFPTSLARSGSDTINASASNFVAINTAWGFAIVVSDGVGNWVATKIGGSASTIASTRLPLKGDNAGNAVAESIQSIGDVSTTVTDFTDIVRLSAALTAPRTQTLPLANKYPAGTGILFVDTSGFATWNNSLKIVRAGADTVQGAAAAFQILGAYGGGGVGSTSASSVVFAMSDGVSAWTVNPSVSMNAAGDIFLVGPSSVVSIGQLARFDLTNFTFDAIVRPGTSGARDLGTNALLWRSLYVDNTIQAAGSTGAKTVNKERGNIRIAAAGTTVTLTNSLVGASSKIQATLQTVDGTAKSVVSTPSAGSVLFTLNAAATAEVDIAWEISIY